MSFWGSCSPVLMIMREITKIANFPVISWNPNQSHHFGGSSLKSHPFWWNGRFSAPSSPNLAVGNAFWPRLGAHFQPKCKRFHFCTLWPFSHFHEKGRIKTGTNLKLPLFAFWGENDPPESATTLAYTMIWRGGGGKAPISSKGVTFSDIFVFL